MRREDIVALARKYHELYRAAEEKWSSFALVQNKTACVDERSGEWAGCAHCCYQLPLGSLVTGVLIADRLIESGEIELLDEVCKQGDEQCLCFAEHGDNAADAWFEKNIPCSLLNSQALCHVYEYRPPACSSYFVAEDTLCCKAKSKTLVKSLNNSELLVTAVVADSEFLAEVFGSSRWEGSILFGPLGMMVKAGKALLESEDRFLSYVASDGEERELRVEQGPPHDAETETGMCDHD